MQVEKMHDSWQLFLKNVYLPKTNPKIFVCNTGGKCVAGNCSSSLANSEKQMQSTPLLIKQNN